MNLGVKIPDDVYTRLFDNGTETSAEDRKVIDTAIRKGVPITDFGMFLYGYTKAIDDMDDYKESENRHELE